MKKTLFILMIIPFFSFAQEKPKEENKKLELKPYGFIKGDMIYATGGVYSWGIPANCDLSAPQLASGKDTSAMGFTAQHTRFGLKGSVGDKVKVGGTIELDFYGGGFDANIKPRMRLAYASISKKGFEARFGQQWDIFSPNNANTNNTNGNMWYAGNRGFRRAQIQLIYKIANEKIAPMIQVSIGETAKETAGFGSDNKSAIPMVQGRLSAKVKGKYEFGVSGVYASYSDIQTATNPTLFYNTTGFCLDFNLDIHKYFSLNGEFNSGTNLNNANLFNIAGNHAWENTGGVFTSLDKKSSGFWFNATSKITTYFNVVLGYGMDKNNTANLPDGYIDGNNVIYCDLIFPINHGFSMALELENINTKNKNSTDFKANIINLSAKVNF